jgi:hypothetical protein
VPSKRVDRTVRPRCALLSFPRINQLELRLKFTGPALSSALSAFKEMKVISLVVE